MGNKIQSVYEEVEDEKGFAGVVKLIQKTGIKNEEAQEADDDRYSEVREAADEILGEQMTV